MKLASNIHTNSIQIHFGLDLNFLKPSPIASFKNVPARIVLLCRSLRRRNLTAHNFPTITCSSRTDRDAREASTSKNVNEAFRFQSHEGADDGGERSCVDASYAVSGEKASASEDYATSFRTVGLCVFSAVAFGVGLSFKDGVGKASEFFAGYLLEQSLSVDNLFVFVLIFKYFKVPLSYQKLVLSYGISGAVVFRLLLILLGTATIQRFEAINLLLATVLLYSSFKLFSEDHEDTDLSDNLIVKTCQKFIPVTSNYDGNRFVTIQDGVWKATPLLLTVAVIELSDIAFAVDSIPAILGVTRDPFIVFSSNLFAILGLRSYFTLISESMEDLKYLQPAVGVVLGFIGCKMILDFFGLHISTEVSLELVATTLISGVVLSLVRKTR